MKHQNKLECGISRRKQNFGMAYLANGDKNIFALDGFYGHR